MSAVQLQRLCACAAVSAVLACSMLVPVGRSCSCWTRAPFVPAADMARRTQDRARPASANRSQQGREVRAPGTATGYPASGTGIAGHRNGMPSDGGMRRAASVHAAATRRLRTPPRLASNPHDGDAAARQGGRGRSRRSTWVGTAGACRWDAESDSHGKENERGERDTEQDSLERILKKLLDPVFILVLQILAS